MSNRNSRDVGLHRNSTHHILYKCRICKRHHPLRKCQSFLRMNVENRLRAVLLFDYCPNCLAHEHSGNTCARDTGCHICSKRHHTLLHFNESLGSHRNRNSTSTLSRVRRHERIPTNYSQLTTSKPSISSILSRHVVPLLPTLTVVVVSGNNKQSSRALIDACSPYSRIESRLVDQLRLNTYKLENDVYCQLTLTAKTDPQVRLAVDARIVSKLPIKTPTTSLSYEVIKRFTHLILADNQFYISQGISLVLGNDLYSKIIKTGVIPGEHGLPMAQDTIFGWVVSGSCAN
ncbi:uncharacterized protein LOC124418541 [Lucilia cuprina]|uniref:uncharacterized protein LOC124418541 n=1 Tax=Lucilia cuprina TaxID=7375 RepID=UPI001F065891|nr:uncharacterized protein LOC124418541 [Lucilia cuprina]